MSATVDYSYYTDVYLGTEADEASFPALCARADDIVGAMTRWQVTADNIDSFPALVQTLYKKAICAQVDYFAVNGLDSIVAVSGNGWTVGKVSVSGKSVVDTVRKGAMSDNIAPPALLYLEQTGLMNPQVPTVPEPSLIGWWY